MATIDDLEPKSKSRRYRTVNGKTVLVCDECGADMALRTNRKTGERFYGCTRYPDCMNTREVPIDQQLRAMGAMKLPGME